ncbi:hypothetical protein AbraIFM66951_002634 [Aspergillus brasiliensis]|uniref:Uncharacterized protein n=1 Tax=Aspergillus brasiliensis (strain CBS 101740 / IMI 381727 / IBT 21946) TaxID=767769 RepID=A0A1L9V318_ASPBC|nr:hypothetical protein ASPBRDRAFT_265783 [Aspergillus brasiliensis CBS 101740]GKZ42702.1 hypothetical protein AbraIFM66951_002634 [Aspergillus brasiliensis]
MGKSYEIQGYALTDPPVSSQDGISNNQQSSRSRCECFGRGSAKHGHSSLDDQVAKNTVPLSCWQTLDTEAVMNVRSSSDDGAFTTNGLLEDYEQLHARCIELSNMCTQGIGLAMNKATIDESRRAIEQSERLKRLTLLATLFIPLSFSSSLLGMNIDLLGQNSVEFWWFLVICIPITLFAYAFYIWDSQYLRRRLVRFWKEWCHARRGLTAAKSRKDPNYIV